MYPRNMAFFLALALATQAPVAQANKKDEAELERVQDAYNARQEKASEEVECRLEARVGTRIKKPVCRTKAFLRQEQFDTQRYMRKPKPSVTRPDAFQF